MSIAAKERWKDEEYRNDFIKSKKEKIILIGKVEFNMNLMIIIGQENLDILSRERDNQVCMNCGKHKEKLNSALDVHHVNYDKQLSIKENCISLCHTVIA